MKTAKQPEMYTDLWACVDCGYAMANGTPENPDPSWNESDMARTWPDFHLVNEGPHEGEDEEADQECFSWQDCDACGSTLGGARMRFAAIYRDGKHSH